MPSYQLSFIGDENFQRRIALGEAEEWEIPFVCDVCGVFQGGGNMSNKSDEKRLICIGCSLLEKELCEEVSVDVNKIVGEGRESSFFKL
ncbi:MAG: hypothetical protein PHQ95_00885 [Candidatus Gracilibacteria bacterium]|nr:hypothetical protein [Candidatus Gracilibacteria bacterium]